MTLAGRSPCFVMCGDDICRDHGCRHVYRSRPVTAEALAASIRADLEAAASPGRAEFVFPDTLASLEQLRSLAADAESRDEPPNAVAAPVTLCGATVGDGGLACDLELGHDQHRAGTVRWNYDARPKLAPEAERRDASYVLDWLRQTNAPSNIVALQERVTESLGGFVGFVGRMTGRDG